jgi:hypothetical protein
MFVEYDVLFWYCYIEHQLGYVSHIGQYVWWINELFETCPSNVIKCILTFKLSLWKLKILTFVNDLGM